MNSFERFSQTLRSVIGISLLLVFLGLGSCQVRKSFQVLLDGSATDEQAHKQLTPGKSLLNATCTGDNSSFNQNLNLPGNTLSIIPPLSSAVFINTFLEFLLTFLVKEDNFKPKALALVRYNTVPVYLKNRSLLI